jgi:hypothetical protein
MNEQDKTETVIVGIKVNQKGSGYIISGVDFDCFAWKKDVLIEQLFVAISTWIENGSGFKLKVIQDKTCKRGYNIVFVEEKKQRVSIPWYVVDNGFTTDKSEDVLENPFL